MLAKETATMAVIVYNDSPIG